MLSKNIIKLQELSRKTCFTLENVAHGLEIQKVSAVYYAAAMFGRVCLSG